MLWALFYHLCYGLEEVSRSLSSISPKVLTMHHLRNYQSSFSSFVKKILTYLSSISYAAEICKLGAYKKSGNLRASRRAKNSSQCRTDRGKMQLRWQDCRILCRITL